MIDDTVGARGLESLRAEARLCGRCPLAASRRDIVLDDGSANADLVIVGEGPGKKEDEKGRPFEGQAGHVLDVLLDGIHLTRSRVYVANVVMCRPPGNRPPRKQEIQACSPYLDRQLALVRPSVVLTLGATATRRLLGPGTLSSHLGERCRLGQATVVPTYHPAALNRAPGRWEQIRKDFEAAKTLLSRWSACDPRTVHHAE